MFAFRKNRQIFADIRHYNEVAKEAMDHFQEALRYVLKKGIDENYETMVRRLDHLESAADDARRKVVYKLYSLGLLPENRKDILMMLEMLDKVLSRAQSVCYTILIQKNIIPEIVKGEFKQILKISAGSYTDALALFDDYLDKRQHIRELVAKIHSDESICDDITRSIIEKLFASDMDRVEVIMIRDLVRELEGITDQCENVADLVTLSDVKTQL